MGLGGIAEHDDGAGRGGHATPCGELGDGSYGAHKRCACTTTGVPLLPQKLQCLQLP